MPQVCSWQHSELEQLLQLNVLPAAHLRPVGGMLPLCGDKDSRWVLPMVVHTCSIHDGLQQSCGAISMHMGMGLARA